MNEIYADFKKDVQKVGIKRAIKKLNKRENLAYYSHLQSNDEDFNNLEESKVDKVTDDFLKGRGEFEA